ncbi:sugar MFS transporter [Pedobacter sp. MW01-1-1]|uniref:sugar MFS transporter n=1 Tax=Pedobacter sp. MW01-1-1 TaxID=3383027 RepID=UPI003FEE11D6
MKINKNTSLVDVGSLTKAQTRISTLILGGLFFIFGFVTWINAILIPYFKIACELSNFESYLVAFAFYISYFIMSIPSSYLLKRVGFKKGIMFGLWIMSIGVFTFIPAALSRTYSIFLMGLFTIGSGLAILQTAANPYITILGPIDQAAKRISIMGICNKGAGLLAPLIFASVVFKVSDNEVLNRLAFMTDAERNGVLDQLIRRVIIPYGILGTVLASLGLFIRYSPLPEINTEEEDTELLQTNADKKHVFHFPYLILGVLAIFMHVGTQVIAIDTVIGYATSMGMPIMKAKVFPSYTLFTTIIGYLLGIVLIPKYISQVNVLRACTLLGAMLTLFIVFSSGVYEVFGHAADISIWFIVLLGLANSLVWAGIWPLALNNLGRFTKVGASILIMALCGSALFPLLYGYVADIYNEKVAYWILFPCYLYLIFYAFYGHKIKIWMPKRERTPSI